MREENTDEISHFETVAKIPIRLIMEGDKRLIFILEKKGNELHIQVKTEGKG